MSRERQKVTVISRSWLELLSALFATKEEKRLYPVKDTEWLGQEAVSAPAVNDRQALRD